MFIREIRAENLFSWESLCREFEPNKVYSFKGYNGSGKSSIFEILTWVFFKKTTKKTIKKYDAKSGQGWITLSDGNNEIVVNRTTANPATVVVNGEETTQENLEDILGVSYLTFMSATMCNQKKVSSFIHEDSGTGKAKIFGEMIGASILDKIRVKVNDLKNNEEMEYSAYKAKINTLQTQLETIELDLDGESIKAYVTALKQRIEKLARYKVKGEELQNAFNLAVEQKAVWDGYDKVKSATVDMKEIIDELGKRIEGLESHYDEPKVKEVCDELKGLSSKAEKCEEKKKPISDKQLLLIQEKRDLLGIVEGDGKCPTCGTQITDKKIIKTQLEKIQSIKIQLDKIHSALIKIDKVVQRIDVKIDENNNFLDYQEKNLANIKRLEESKIDKEKNLKHFADTKKPSFKRPSIEEPREALNGHTAMVFDIQKEIEAKRNVVKNYKNIKKALVIVKDGIGKKEQRYELFKWLFDNIPVMKLRFIDQNKAVVEDLINEQISSMGLPFAVKIDTQRELKKGAKIKDEFTFKILNVNFDKEAHRKDLSGGQEVCILLATQFAINSVSKSNLTFEIYDEIYGSLDDKNIAVIIDTIKERGGQRQIFSISHKDEISNSFDESINIKMEDGCSYVR